MTVTEIKPVTKQKFQIELDGQPAFVLYKGELSRYHIQKGDELEEAVYREIVDEVLTKRAKLRAMHLLEKMDRTKAELRRKLEQSGYPSEAVEAALTYVESFHYIDDSRYAARYIEFQKEKKGKARLKMELQQKGIPSQIVSCALEEAEDTMNPRDTIRRMMESKRKSNGPLEEKEKQRLYGFFMRKGFSSSDILAVFREKGEKEWEDRPPFC